jgi:lysophospholipase L1-like esterase
MVTPIRIGQSGKVAADGQAVLDVKDVWEGYTIPYIQSSRDLEITVERTDSDGPAGPIELALEAGGRRVWTGQVGPGQTVTARDLPPGEYSLTATAGQGGPPEQARVERIGIGTVIAALGDSITEGYHGRETDWSGWGRAEQFPPDMVSRDGRNFPQEAPTTPTHRGGRKCMMSWMTGLNDRLAAGLGRPVFIANEGWGGIRTDGYLQRIRTDENWRQRIRQLRPTLWLIHLGVNDERDNRPAADVARDLEAMIDALIADYAARPEAILIAWPCYDYAEGAAAILATYCGVIDELVARRGLLAGPDFFDAYSRDQQRYYGDDPVHPNPEGMKLMASLWAQSILRHRARWDR